MRPSAVALLLTAALVVPAQARVPDPATHRVRAVSATPMPKMPEPVVRTFPGWFIAPAPTLAPIPRMQPPAKRQPTIRIEGYCATNTRRGYEPGVRHYWSPGMNMYIPPNTSCGR